MNAVDSKKTLKPLDLKPLDIEREPGRTLPVRTGLRAGFEVQPGYWERSSTRTKR